MTKRNLFTTLAAIFVSAAFLAGCDHALSQQTASVTFSIPADVLKGMLQNAQPASEQEIAKMALASRQAAGADGAYATLTVSLSEHAAPQTRFFTEEEFNAIESGASAIAPFDFTGLPVGARVTVTAALLLTDGMYYEDSAEVALAVGPNSVSLTMRAKTRRLALVAATRGTGEQLAQGESVTFSHEDGNATIVLTVSPAGGVTYGDGNTPIGANGVTGRGSITLRFNNVTTSGNPLYTVTARATRDDPTYIDSTAVFTYTVQGDALNQVTVSPPHSDVALIRGVNSRVTFSHGDNAATIHLRVTSTATSTAAPAFTIISGGTASGENVTGAMGQSVALEFTAAGGYTVTARATRDGYANSSEATFPYTVVNPKLEGKVEANQQSGALTMVEGQAAVTFTYTDATVPDASIVLTGLPTNGAGFTVANGNGSAINVSDDGTWTGAAGQSVTVTFTAEGDYNNITAYAEKADYEKSDGITVSHNVQRPQLGVVTMSRSVSASATIASGSTVTLTRNDVVTFSYASTDGVTDAQIVVSGLPDSGVSVMSNNNPLTPSSGQVTGEKGQTVVVTFTATDATQRTITAKATRAHHTDSPNATFSYTVANPKLGGSITATPAAGAGNPAPQGTTLTRGDSVTFSYSGSETENGVQPTIHLTLNNTAGVTAVNTSDNSSITVSSGTITGKAGSSVKLTFEPTTDPTTYDITNVYASLTDYQNSTPAADLTYTVDFPQLSGTFTATPSGSTTSAWQSGSTVNTLSRGDTVTFRYTDSNGVTGAQVVVSGLPNGATATSNGQSLDLSSGTVTGAAGQSVTVTFGNTTTNTSTITVKATKQYYREAAGQSYVCKVDDPKLTGKFDAYKNTGGNLTEGDNTANPNTLTRGESVTFSYTNTNSPTVTDAQIVLSGLTGSGFAVRNGTATSGATITASPDGTYKGSGTSVTVTFTSNVATASTISVKATKADYQDTTETRYAYTVGNPTLSGTISANPPSGTQLTRHTNDTVTFSYNGSETGANTGAAIHLTVSPTTGFSVASGGSASGGTVTGTGGPVTLKFEPTSDNTSYTISGAYASMSGYENSTQAATSFTYPVQFSQFTGNVEQMAGGVTISSNLTLPKGVQVTFNFNETNPTSGSGTPTLDLRVSKTGAAIQASDITVAAGEGTYNNGTVTGTRSSVTLTFNTTGSYTVTPTAKKSGGYKDQSGSAVTFTVADFTARVRLAIGGADLAQSDGNTSFTLGAGVQSLTVSLYYTNTSTNTGTLYTGGGVSGWSVTATDSAGIESGGSTNTFDFIDDVTDLYTLSVSAAVYGTTVGPYEFTVMRVTTAAMQRTVTINKPVTIAPTNNITIYAPASGAAFIIESGGTLTLGGNVTIDGQNNERTDALVKVHVGTLNLKDSAKIQNNNNTALEGGGGGVYIYGRGEFNMSGGMISGNTARRGGGVSIYEGLFTMGGGSISDNTSGYDHVSSGAGSDSSGYGAGVWVSGASTFTISGGTITRNTVSSGVDVTGSGGGGVYVASDGTFTNPPGSGSITNNAATGLAKGSNRYISSGATYNGEKQTADIID